MTTTQEALSMAMDLLSKIVDSERYPIAMRCDAQELLRRWKRGEFLKDRQEQAAEMLTLENARLKKLIVEALPFMRARHEWKPTAPYADMIQAMESAVGGRCPSTYTHSTLGKLSCEKDEAHLHRIGDVEHRGEGIVWMSV